MGFNPNKMQKEFPLLYAKNKNGVWKEWKIRVHMERDDDPPVVEIQHGQQNGKMITDTQIISKEKRGYDTLWDQAIFTAQSKWNHKHDRENYRTTMTEEQILAPMLAKTFDKGKHLSFPLYIQPKIDGLRCLAQWDGTGVRLYSRTGCAFQGLHAIRHELTPFFQKDDCCVVDGELYSNDIPFEELSGYCRRQKDLSEDKEIFYHVFDIITPLPFHERIKKTPQETGHVRLVPTYEINTMGEVEDNLNKFIAQGYEGIILRNRDGMYRTGHRSWDLQKYKLFQEEEFIITGYTEGTGREKGLVIWECHTARGKKFNVRPDGDHKTRQKMFQDAPSCIGKRLTVVFQEYTKDMVPRFPVAKAIREGY